MKINKEEISDRLKHFITSRFKNISEAAEKLEISESSLRSSYLNGKSLPGFEALYSLYLNGCDIDWLFTGKRNLFRIDEKLKKRISKKVKELKDYYLIKDEDLVLEKVQKEVIEEFINKSNEFLPNSAYAKMICYNWKVDESLDVNQIPILCELLNLDLLWLLTGELDLKNESLNSMKLKYPELSLLLELRKDPNLFRKIKLLVDSEISGTTTKELSELKNKIDSIDR